MLFTLSFVIAQVVAPQPSTAVATPAAAVASPAPCPSATPAAVSFGASKPLAKPTDCGGLRTIAHGASVGRKANLVGIARAASEGTIDQEEIATRPILRPGEVLEAVPGLVISQHSGEGKANQYYLRGFQLDHGTNLESTLNGVPVNLGTHAHGQGYSDINYLIPELVSFVEFKKGTYYADQGDFSTAGSYNLFYRNTIAPTLEVGAGNYGYNRLLMANTIKVGSGDLLGALEIYHDNGTFSKPDEYHKLNGVLRYSHLTTSNDLTVTGIAYNGAFNSTDQIPQRLVDAGVLSHYGFFDPSDGGNTYRYALSAQYEHRDAHGKTDLNLYGVKSFLDLFSNFTYFQDDGNDYYNVTSNPVTCNPSYATCTPNAGMNPRVNSYVSYCPGNNSASAGAAPGSVTPAPFSFSCGDQREQVDNRFYGGFALSHTYETPGTTTTLGVGVRNDNAATVGLFLDKSKVRFPNGRLSLVHAVTRDSDAFLQSDLRFGKLRFDPGVRADIINYVVHDALGLNSGAATTALVSPKFNVAFALNPHNEFYLDYGASFHSNDARGVIGDGDPQTLQATDSGGNAVIKNAPITRAYGEEVGYRFSAPKLTSTVSYYQLRLANELVFDGDHGTTSLNGPTLRKGLEFANFFTPARGLTIDADIATATANYTTNDSNSGTAIPESLNNVDSLGLTVDQPRFSASFRMRYFGPRALENTGVFKSNPSTVFNAQLTAKMHRNSKLEFELLNVFNQQSDDVQYYYGSYLPQDAANPTYANDATVNPTLGGAGVSDYHVHPSQKRVVRLNLTMPL